MVVVEVVGIDKIKLFRNFVFPKSTVIFTGYQYLFTGYFVFEFDMSKKNNICVMFVTSTDGLSGILSIAGLKNKHFAQEAPQL
jgi:hypothetical protein